MALLNGHVMQPSHAKNKETEGQTDRNVITHGIAVLQKNRIAKN